MSFIINSKLVDWFISHAMRMVGVIILYFLFISGLKAGDEWAT